MDKDFFKSIGNEEDKKIMDKQKQLAELENKFHELWDKFYNDSIVTEEKNKLINKLANEFKNYFQEVDFKILETTEKNFLGECNVISATKDSSKGQYKIKMTISKGYRIDLEVQHKDDFGKEEYIFHIGLSENEIDRTINPFCDPYEDINSKINILNRKIESNAAISVICKAHDGQDLEFGKEYTTFKEIIKDIPQK